MIRYKISIEYNGIKFSGWQKQPDVCTVQQTIEEALAKLEKKNINVVCAGRTDAGVHAIEQIAHFDMAKDFDTFTLQQALNHHLKGLGISIFNVEKMPIDSNFHARFSAQSREYIYKILNRRYPPTFASFQYWWIPVELDLELMIDASKILLGTHDFSSFRANGCQAKSPIRSIDEINFTKDGDVISMHIKAPSFLYHQVRNIIGTLYLIGRKKMTKQELIEALNAKNRASAGITAPPFGLYFYKVNY
jgi:tRNA pseudouridine38-40 synthase